MRIPTLSAEQLAVCLGDRPPDTPPSVDQLAAQYQSTRSVPALLAWSDAVGRETVRLLAEVEALRERDRKIWARIEAMVEAEQNRRQACG